jgi:NosR/NirI family transcriptional regulator, nitrous oxide reductase regulator
MSAREDPRRRVALPVLDAARPARSRANWQTWCVRGVRLGLLLAAAALFGVAHQRLRMAELGQLVTLDEARRLFPAAQRLGPPDLRRKWHPVLDARGESLGVVLRTAPETDRLIGYAGPSDLLIGLGNDGRVLGVELVASSDTPAHVADVRRSTAFWKTWTGWSPGTEPPPAVSAVSGSTLTSLAMAEAVEQRLTGQALSLRFPRPVDLEEARTVYPDAAALETDVPRPGWLAVSDAQSELLGYLLRTAPAADQVIGYRGPTEALLAVAPDQRQITAVRLRDSYDTPEYVDRVREDATALTQLAGRTIDDWAALDFQQAGIEGVSGATQTSYAVAEGMRQRARREVSLQVAAAKPWWTLRDASLLALTLGALAIGFTSWRGAGLVRRLWQAVLIFGFGLWCGDLLSLGLLAGWSRTGWPWATAPGLLALVAVALLSPVIAGRNVYCHYLCPHGAAQEWLGRWRVRGVSLPSGGAWWLGRLPGVLLLVGGLWALHDAGFDLALLEPFDAWTLKGRWSIPLTIAVVGLVATLFVPMAYCRFGCPTGALLKFLVTGGETGRLGRRDAVAAGVLLCAAGMVFGPAWLSGDGTGPTPGPLVLRGEAFGTSWSVTLRQAPADAAALRSAVAQRLEQIESRLSSWRPESETSQFNASETTFEMDVSPDLLALLRFADRLRQRTNGAFDPTVGPLVDLWGYGPSLRTDPPTEAEIAAVLPHVGGGKLTFTADFPAVSKEDPALQIDLGALLQGYAADQLAGLLRDTGMDEFLIDVGGELYAAGTWSVAIEDPRDPARPLETVTLTDAALATSGIYRRGRDGSTQTRHILSPQTGRPVEPYWQLCAVQAKSALEADGWATALLAMAGPVSVAVAKEEGLTVLFVDQAGTILRVPPDR